jgi:hypothetical protein
LCEALVGILGPGATALISPFPPRAGSAASAPLSSSDPCGTTPKRSGSYGWEATSATPLRSPRARAERELEQLLMSPSCDFLLPSHELPRLQVGRAA